MPTYRTTEHRTDRILKNWLNQEELAFQLETSLSLKELQAALPESCKEQFGELKPTDNTFRKMSSGFNNVSDIWLELMRLLGVEDFSPEQAILGNVSTVLDKENVRVRLNISENKPSRRNSIDVLCLDTPKYQGLIRYEGNRLLFPNSIFEALIDRRLQVYQMNCEDLQDRLLIPGVSDPQSLLIAENNARLAEEHRGLDEQPKLDELDGVSAEDAWMDSSDAELESARIEEEARAAHIEQMTNVAEHIQLIGSVMTDDTEASDDAIALNPYDGDEVDDTDEDAEIETAVDGHGSEIYEVE